MSKSLENRHVLVVEDAVMHQKVIRALLEPQGAVVYLAATGEKALELFATRRFDLVLMDHYLPGIDGLETTRLMRARETSARTPIVGASATNDERARAEFLSAGADDTLSKPVRLDEFWTKFRSILAPG